MGQVRWAGWTAAIATALALSGGQVRADVATEVLPESDKPAALVIYPLIKVDSGLDTVVRLTNTSSSPAYLHCFYVDANSHCFGANEGDICSDSSDCCSGASCGECRPGWAETDFHIIMTPGQPIQWKASDGFADDDLPLGNGVCERNPFKKCSVDDDCKGFPGGKCTKSNAGTRVPPVSESRFVGELKCIAVDANGNPIVNNVLKGEALIETANSGNLDVASYNAIGIQATGTPGAQIQGPELTLGPGDTGEYEGCPNILILNHFFDDAHDPVPGSDSEITTTLVLVPCSEDLLRQIPGAAVVQYLVFNEFEQRFSTSNTVKCFLEERLCKLDRAQCSRSIFNVSVAGTLTGQTRMNPIGVAMPPPQASIPSGMVGIAIETHANGNTRSAAFNLHQQGNRATQDLITIP